MGIVEAIALLFHHDWPWLSILRGFYEDWGVAPWQESELRRSCRSVGAKQFMTHEFPWSMKLLSGIFLAVIIVFWFPRTIQEYKLQRSNNQVMVIVERLPDCPARYKHKFIHVRYNGSTHVLRTKCKFVAGLSVGQQLEMLHKEGSEIFLFKNEDVTFEVISLIALSFVAVACFIISFRRG